MFRATSVSQQLKFSPQHINDQVKPEICNLRYTKPSPFSSVLGFLPFDFLSFKIKFGNTTTVCYLALYGRYKRVHILSCGCREYKSAYSRRYTYVRRAYAKMPEWSTYTHDHRDLDVTSPVVCDTSCTV